MCQVDGSPIPKERITLLYFQTSMVFDVKTGMRSCSIVLHTENCSQLTQNLKDSPEGEGFRPIVETIRTA